MENKKITIITPTYNRAHTIERLCKSLEHQSFKSFKWLIMDDGSTDNTTEIVHQLIANSPLEIEYHRHDNVHKVITLHRGFKKITTPYTMRVDSDDYLPINALEILYKNMESIKDDDTIASVIGRVEYSTNKKLGDEFPTNPFIEFVFLMKYKYRIKGVHMGLFKTKMIQQSSFKEEEYLGKGYIPDFWNFEIDSKYRSMFINDIIYTYDLNDSDLNSISKTKFNPKFAFGLSEQYRHFIKYYLPLYWNKYPIAIIKNMFKYIYYSSFREDIGFWNRLTSLDDFRAKILFLLMALPVKLYKIFSPELKAL